MHIPIFLPVNSLPESSSFVYRFIALKCEIFLRFFQQFAESFSAFSAGRLKAPANALRQCAAPSWCKIQLYNNSIVQIAVRISDLIQQLFQPFLLWQSVFHCILLQFLQFRLFNRADVPVLHLADLRQPIHCTVFFQSR